MKTPLHEHSRVVGSRWAPDEEVNETKFVARVAIFVLIVVQILTDFTPFAVH